MGHGAKEESEEKIRRKRGLSPLPHPLVVVVFCFFVLTSLSPPPPALHAPSKHLEQAMLVST